ncbi:MAG: hypothetical protein DRQ55_13435 [Planctomycetota bacterium]|nr:MAG: hypothetical protein DRQ55_13435 [Planctomycetota bacterium]
MAQPTSDRSSGGGAALLLMLAAIGGTMWFSGTPQSFRPPQPDPWLEVSGALEGVSARLWQDPMGAVADYKSRLADEARKARDAQVDSGTQREASGESEAERLQALQAQIMESAHLLVLPVLVPGDNYTASVETRLRTRTAVVSALHAQQFHPVKRDHIGFASLPDDLTRWTDPPRGMHHFDLPFEWFAPDSVGVAALPLEGRPADDGAGSEASPEPSIVVLWVDERYLGCAPLAQLDGLLDYLMLGTQPADTSTYRRDVRVLGPTSSNILQQMLKEHLSAGSTAGEADAGAGTTASITRRILNYRATAPEALLMNALGAQEAQAPPALQASDDAPVWNYERIISGDEDLLLALVFELSLRGVKLWPDGEGACADQGTSATSEAYSEHHGSADAVVLVGEFDTFYGRAFPVTWSAAVDYVGQLRDNATLSRLGGTERSSGTRTPEGVLQYLRERPDAAEKVWAGFGSALRAALKSSPRRDRQQPQLIRYSYLRGLDGMSVGGGAETSEQSATGSKDSAGEEQWQQPVGTSQLDFVRRLTRTLEGISAEADGVRSRIGAIGIVGTDPYDKQLILQALRARMRGAPVFSTDLDARLLHESQSAWSRNLIVASGFGLELRPELQLNIAPFRSGYQTAAFLATRLAVGGPRILEPRRDAAADDSDAQPRAGARWLPPHDSRPRVFEVARNGAVDLTPHAFSSPLHPPATAQVPDSLGIVAVAIMAICLLLATSRLIPTLSLLWGSPKGKISSDDATHWRRYLLGLLLLTASSLGVTAWFLLSVGPQTIDTGEPVALFDGVSIWPTLVVRLLVLNICLYGIVLGIGALDRNAATLERRFGLKRGQVQKATWRGFRDGWLWNLGFVSEPRGQGRRSVQTVWDTYRSNSQLRYTSLRVGLLVALYMAFAAGLFVVFGFPRSPARGEWARMLDQLTLIVSVVALVTLILFIVDVTRECERLVEYLAKRQSSWPPAKCSARNNRRILDEMAVSELFDVQFVARRTRVVGELIVLPFVALLFTIISRNQLFDGWDWPVSLIVVLGVHALFSICSAVRMRRAAERVRAQSLRRLSERLTLHLGGISEESRAMAEQVRQLMEEIAAVSSGAFAPWSRSPALRALLMPFGGVGALALIDMLAQTGV